MLALILACIGIYGLMPYDVARRTNEIGTRGVIGAQTGQMLRMVLREASWIAVARSVVGSGGALLLAKICEVDVVWTTPNDPWVMGGSGGAVVCGGTAGGVGIGASSLADTSYGSPAPRIGMPKKAKCVFFLKPPSGSGDSGF